MAMQIKLLVLLLLLLKELRYGEIVLKTDSDGKEYLEYFERQTKTQTGEDPWNQWPIKPRMYANNDAFSMA